MKRTSQSSLLSFIKRSKQDASSPEDNRSINSLELETSNTTDTGTSADIPISHPSTSTSNSIIMNSIYPLNDVAIVSKKTLADTEKFEAVNDLWFPPPNFNFPSKQEGKYLRKFNQKYLVQHTWLVYSVKEDGVYCKFCAFYSKSEIGFTGRQEVGALCKNAFRSWKKSGEKFASHEKAEYHKQSVLKYLNFKKIMENVLQPVDKLLFSNREIQAKENRLKLMPIINTVIFCGRNGLPLRGHQDYGPLNMNNLSEVSPGEGNFRALLKLRIDAGDHTLKNHLLTCPKNATYISSVTQNEIISACNQIILKKVISDVKGAHFFSVLADETTDVAKIEQFALCVRYLKNKSVEESFLQFVPVTSTTGENLGNVIIKKLSSYGLDMNNLRGQGYDGAASMSGRFNGVQAVIKKSYPTALYVHCVSHSLNLAISDACSVQPIRNCMGIIENAYNFFNTPKRQNVLTQKIDELPNDLKLRRDRLKQLCPTRWVQRQDSINVMKQLFTHSIHALEEICEWQEKEASSGAKLLLNTLSSSEFIISLLVAESVFAFTLPLSKILQSKNIDLFHAITLAENCLKELKSMRETAETSFVSIFDEAKKIVEDNFQGELKKPRITTAQRNRANYQTESTEQYYKIYIFIPFLDGTITQLQERFVKHKDILTSFNCLIPTPNKKSDNELHRFNRLMEFYKNDLINVSTSVASAEFKLWYRQFQDHAPEDFPKSAISALEICDEVVYPNIHTLLKIFCTLPVSTATPERRFSTLKLLKSYLRNTIGENRLNGLTLLYIYPSISVTEEEVLSELQKKGRKIDILI